MKLNPKDYMPKKCPHGWEMSDCVACKMTEGLLKAYFDALHTPNKYEITADSIIKDGGFYNEKVL